MTNDLQAPWIGNPPEETEYPPCPICDADDYEELFENNKGDICGCDKCMKRIDYYDYVWGDR